MLLKVPKVEGFLGLALTKEAQALSLEDTLERRKVDDQQLSHDGAQHGVAEHPVAAQTHLMYHAGLTNRERTCVKAGCPIYMLRFS